MKHLLFICSQNRLRSPTAEVIFSKWSSIEAKSADLNDDATIPLNQQLIVWAHVTCRYGKITQEQTVQKILSGFER